MRGTTMSWLTAMPCTMPRAIASWLFHRSWPARPGRMNVAARTARTAGDGGSVSRGSMDPRRPPGSSFLFATWLLGVAAPELLDAACGIDELLLAGVVRVGLGGDLDLDHRVFLAVGPLHGLAALGVDRRAGEKGMIRAGVEEDHRLVFVMRAWFHDGPSVRRRGLYTGNLLRGFIFSS